MDNHEGLIIEGLPVLIGEGLPQGYAGVFEPGRPGNPGTEPVVICDLDTYVRLHDGDADVQEQVRELVANAKRGLKVKRRAQERREAKNARRLAHYAGPR